MVRHLSDSDFLLVTPGELPEVWERAARAPFFRNGLLCMARDHRQIEVGGVVVFSFKNAIDRLGEIGQSNDL